MRDRDRIVDPTFWQRSRSDRRSLFFGIVQCTGSLIHKILIANYEAFCWNISLSTKFLFLKSNHLEEIGEKGEENGGIIHQQYSWARPLYLKETNFICNITDIIRVLFRPITCISHVFKRLVWRKISSECYDWVLILIFM